MADEKSEKENTSVLLAEGKDCMELFLHADGEDVYKRQALAEGIGEKLTSLPPMVKCPVVIAKPQVSVSTKYVYENLKLDEHCLLYTSRCV